MKEPSRSVTKMYWGYLILSEIQPIYSKTKQKNVKRFIRKGVNIIHVADLLKKKPVQF